MSPKGDFHAERQNGRTAERQNGRGLLTVVAIGSLIASSSCLASDPARPVPPGWVPPAAWIAESRAAAVHMWQSADAGALTPGLLNFQFTTTVGLPADVSIFNEAIGLFQDVFRERLQLDPFLPGYYTASDLIRDDACVRQAFRTYTTTGVLSTPLNCGFSKHWELIVEALSGSGEYVLPSGTFWAAGGTLNSRGLTVARPYLCFGTPLTLSPGSPEQQFDDQLKQDVRESRLETPASPTAPKIGFRDDPWPPTTPGFDCDDYADAEAGWLQHELEPQYPGSITQKTIHVFDVSNLSGHTMNYIEKDGTFYLVDPQSGKVMGPFDKTNTKVLCAMRSFLKDSKLQYTGMDPDNHHLEYQLKTPPQRPIVFPLLPIEPPSWQTDQSTRDWFQNELDRVAPGRSVTDYIYQ